MPSAQLAGGHCAAALRSLAPAAASQQLSNPRRLSQRSSRRRRQPRRMIGEDLLDLYQRVWRKRNGWHREKEAEAPNQ